MEKLWKKNFRQIIPYVPGEQSKDTDIVKINANENPYPPSPKAVRAIREFNTDGLRFYPPSDVMPLKEAIASFYGVQPTNVFVGNGSDDVIALAFQSFFNGDKPIAYPDITYSFYPVWCDLFGIKYNTYPLDNDFRINPDDYAAANGGVVIPNPNAPTSLGEDLDFVRRILDENRDSVVIIDEAYADFSGVTCVPLTSEYDNLLMTGTFSKSRSLAGLRIGFAIGSADLINELEAVKNSYNSYTVDSISVAAGVEAMNDREYFESTVSKIIATRSRVTEELRSMGFTVLDSSTNFLMVTHSEYSMRDMFEFLKSKKVFIRYFSQPRIDRYVRVTVGTDDEMDRFLTEVKNFITE